MARHTNALIGPIPNPYVRFHLLALPWNPKILPNEGGNLLTTSRNSLVVFDADAKRFLREKEDGVT